MKIGVYLPSMVPGVTRDVLLEWARRADLGPLSSLCVIDRVVYPGHDPLIALAAAAAVTERIGLMSGVLLGPMRQTGILAKQIASIDALSGGRVTVGLGVGMRTDDFEAASAAFKGRGKRFDDQILTLRRLWAGEPFSSEAGPVGPVPGQPGGPKILLGGFAPTALDRVGRLADGFIASGAPAEARQEYDTVLRSWQAAGRSGQPRFVNASYFVLGPDARSRLSTYAHDYYGFYPPYAELIAQYAPASVEEVRAAIAANEAVGVDELLFVPGVADPDQVDRLIGAIR
ncbi:MAG: LLM class flavin-dependent oxidoreductase [Chloroflexota bacterium]